MGNFRTFLIVFGAALIVGSAAPVAGSFAAPASSATHATQHPHSHHATGVHDQGGLAQPPAARSPAQSEHASAHAKPAAAPGCGRDCQWVADDCHDRPRCRSLGWFCCFIPFMPCCLTDWESMPS